MTQLAKWLLKWEIPQWRTEKVKLALLHAATDLRTNLLAVLAYLVTYVSLILSILMVVFGLYYIGNCPGSGFRALLTFVVGVPILTLVLSLPFKRQQEIKSYDYTMEFATILNSITFQIYDWISLSSSTTTSTASTPALNESCDEEVYTFGVASASIMILLDVLLPISIFLLAIRAFTWGEHLLKPISCLSKILMPVIGFLGLVVLPVACFAAGGMAVYHCTVWYPGLPVLLLLSAFCYCLIDILIVLGILLKSQCLLDLVFIVFVLQYGFYPIGFFVVLGKMIDARPTTAFRTGPGICDQTVYSLSVVCSLFTYFFSVYGLLLVSDEIAYLNKWAKQTKANRKGKSATVGSESGRPTFKGVHYTRLQVDRNCRDKGSVKANSLRVHKMPRK